jgi:HD-GYP domain-containing protein (c-di-GMP phosphodiesterase class II)
VNHRLPLRARVFITAVVVTAGGILTFTALTQRSVDWELALVLGAFVFLAGQFPVALPIGEGAYSVGFVMIVTAIILGGPTEAAIAASFAFVTLRESRGVSFVRHLFNVSEIALAATVAGLAYRAILPERITDQADIPSVLLPTLAFILTQFIVNTGLVSIVLALVRGVKMRTVWRSQFAGLLGGSIAFAALGILLAALYIPMKYGAVLFLLVPLLVARNAFQSAVEMEVAYDRTVKSMISAIEAKDPYTRGHAERVSRLSEMTARAYGLSAEQCRVIRYIALMHDVGKLGVSTKILAKPGKLTDEEYEHMKQHPIRGYEIVSEIDFLREAAETAVRHHHERMDGRGYPDGLVGDEIPVIARIVMVCDAFDSMTSTRVYRKAKSIESAFVELNRCVGTQFDPVSLRALEKAIATEGWEAEPEEEEEQADVTIGPAAAAL